MNEEAVKTIAQKMKVLMAERDSTNNPAVQAMRETEIDGMSFVLRQFGYAVVRTGDEWIILKK